MAFKFGDTKKTEGQDTGFEPIPEGKYEFQIEKVAINAYGGSAKINPCDKLDITLRIDMPNGNARKVWDTIFLDDAHAYSMRKLTHLVDSCSLSMSEDADKYEIANTLKDGIGNAEIIIETYNGKRNNKVKEYVVPEKPQLTEEDLPF